MSIDSGKMTDYELYKFYENFIRIIELNQWEVDTSE